MSVSLARTLREVDDMTRMMLAPTALALLTLANPVLAGDAETQRVTLETTSVGTVGSCKADVARSVKICDADDNCRRLNVEDETRFEVPRGGSFVVSASVSYIKDGIIHGDAAVDRFEKVTDGERLIQSLQTGDQCSQVWSYEIRAE